MSTFVWREVVGQCDFLSIDEDALNEVNELTQQGWEVFKIHNHPITYAKGTKNEEGSLIEERTLVERSCTRYYLRKARDQDRVF